MIPNIWRRWVSRLFQRVAPRRLVRQRRRLLVRPLGMERLEDRVVPTVTNYWTGAAGAGNLFWSNTQNWSAGAPSSGEILEFSSTVPGFGNVPLADRVTTDDLPAALPGGYSSITISAGGYEILNPGGSPSTIDLAGNLNINSGISNIPIQPNVQFTGQLASPSQADQTVTVNSGSILYFEGQLEGAGTATQIAQQTLLLNGPGEVELDAANTSWTGAITLSNGVLVNITNSDALGLGAKVANAPDAGITTINKLSELELDGTLSAAFSAAPSVLTVPETLIINAAGVNNLGALYNAANANGQSNTWGGTTINAPGNIEMDSATTIGAAPNTTLTVGINSDPSLNAANGGVISDLNAPQNLTTTGGGTIVFAHPGGNTYRGTTSINWGTLEIEDPQSLGAGSISTSPYSGTPQAETIVNYNSTNQEAGTLELNFNTKIFGEYNTPAYTDPSGIITSPTAAYNAATNPYAGFQVFNDLLVLNGPGVNGIGALYNLFGDNGWDGNVQLGSVSSSNNVPVNIGAAANSSGSWAAPNTNLTISGIVSEPTAGYTPTLNKVGAGRVILTDADTYTGPAGSYGTTISAGDLMITDSTALGTGTLQVDNNASLELAVDQGFDGTAQRTHDRNLGSDSITGSGPGQEVYVTGTGTFTLTYNGEITKVLSATDPNLAADMQAALNALPAFASNQVTVTQDGDIYRVTGGGINQTAARDSIPLMTSTKQSGSPTVSINAIYGLNVDNTVTEYGSGATTGTGGREGAIASLSGINTYSGTVNIGYINTPGTIDVQIGSFGVWPDGPPSAGGFGYFPGETPVSRQGHPTADDNYFQWDYSLTVYGEIQNYVNPITLAVAYSDMLKFSDGQLIVPGDNTYGYTDAVLINPATGVPYNGYTNTATGNFVDYFNGITGISNPSTIVEAGWITTENSQSLGPNAAPAGGLPQTNFLTVQVNSGGSVELDSQAQIVIAAGSTGTFTLAYTGVNSAGATVTDSTTLTATTILADTPAAAAALIQTALQGLGNIGGIGGTVTVTEAAAGVFTYTFGGALTANDLVNLTVTKQPTTGSVAVDYPNETLYYNWILGGNGISQPFPLIDKGALENMAAANTLAGIVQLNGNGGIGVEQVFPTTATPVLNASQLTTTNEIENYVGTTGDPAASSGIGGLTKWGSRRLIVQGASSFGGNVNIEEGVLLDQNNTGLGAGNSLAVGNPPAPLAPAALPNVTVEPGAALELGNSIASLNSGISGGLGIWGDNLVLDSAGDPTFGDTGLTVTSGNSPTGATVQTITVTGQPSGGFFLSFNGQETSEIPGNATAAQVQAALTALSTIGGYVPNGVAGTVNVVQSQNGNANVYIVTFGGSLLDTTFPIQPVDSTFGGAFATTAVTQYGKATTYTVTASAGTFTLGFGGQTTAALAYNAGFAAVQQALQGLSTIGTAIGTGNVTVTQSVSGATNVYTIVFGGSLMNTSTPLVVTGANAYYSAQPASYNLTVSQGSFFLEFNGKMTGLLSYNSGAAAIAAALNGLTSIGGAGGTVAVTALANGSGYNITFGQSLSNTTIPLVLVTSVAYAPVAGADSIPEVMVGSFTLTFGGDTTTVLPAAASATTVQNALDALASIGGVNGSVTVTLTAGVYKVTFTGVAAAAITLNTITDAAAANAYPGTLVMPYNDLLQTTDDLWDGPVQLTANTTLTVETNPSSTYTDSRLVITGDITSPTVGITNVVCDGTTSTITVTSLPATFQVGETVTVTGLTGTNDVLNGTYEITAIDTAAGTFSFANSNAVASNPTSGGTAALDFNLTLGQLPVNEIGGLVGGGELDLDGTNSYGGSTFITQGVMTIGGNQALGGTPVAEVQTLDMSGLASGTQYTLSFTPYGGGPASTSTTLTWQGGAMGGNDLASLQNALNTLPTLGQSNANATPETGLFADSGALVTVTQVGTGVYQITYGGSLAGFQQNVLQVYNTAGTSVLASAVDTAFGDQIGGGGTVVSDGATLQLAGSFTVAGEPLLIEGNGGGSADVPSQWFQVGPEGNEGGQAGSNAGGEQVAGQVTGIVIDPNNPNIIYIATGGGGAWKTIDGGLTWVPIFDSIPENQTVTVNPTTAKTFTLSFTYGATTDKTVTLDADDPNLAADMQNALNALGDIGGSGGIVSVMYQGNDDFSVAFGGTLAGLALNQLTAAGAGVTTSVVEVGADNSFAMYVGAIAMDPTSDRTLYLGTGTTQNVPTSYYGVGMFESTDGGLTWHLMTGNEIQQIAVHGFGPGEHFGGTPATAGTGFVSTGPTGRFKVAGTKGAKTFSLSAGSSTPSGGTTSAVYTAGLGSIVSSGTVKVSLHPITEVQEFGVYTASTTALQGDFNLAWTDGLTGVQHWYTGIAWNASAGTVQQDITSAVKTKSSGLVTENGDSAMAGQITVEKDNENYFIVFSGSVTNSIGAYSEFEQPTFVVSADFAEKPTALLEQNNPYADGQGEGGENFNPYEGPLNVVTEGGETITITAAGSQTDQPVQTFAVTPLPGVNANSEATVTAPWNPFMDKGISNIEAEKSTTGPSNVFVTDGDGTNLNNVDQVETLTFKETLKVPGTFELEIGGYVTTEIAYNPSTAATVAANIQTDLDQLLYFEFTVGGGFGVAAAGSVEVSVIGGSATSTEFAITFEGGLVDMALPLLQVENPSPNLTPDDGGDIIPIIQTIGGDQPADQIDVLQFYVNPPPNPLYPMSFTLSFTGEDATGTVNTYTTPTLYNYNPATGAYLTAAQIAANMQTALDNLPNIGGIGGFVNVLSVPDVYEIEFEGALADTTVQPLAPVSNPTDQIYSGIMEYGNPVLVADGTLNNSSNPVIDGEGGAPGVWEFVAGGPQWTDLTGGLPVGSPRVMDVTQNGSDTPYGPATKGPYPQFIYGPGPLGFPDTPGPEDDYRYSFPQAEATWTGLAIVSVYEAAVGEYYDLVFGGLGTAQGPINSTVAEWVNTVGDNYAQPDSYNMNGVFWTVVPQDNEAVPSWFAGNPFKSPGVITAPDTEKGELPLGGPLNSSAGVIRIAATSYDAADPPQTGTYDADEPLTEGYETIDVSITDAQGGFLLGAYQSTNGGMTWATTLVPGNYLSGQGFYASSIATLPLQPNVIYLAGSVSEGIATQQQEIVWTANAGTTWANLSPDAEGNGPHSGIQTIAIDSEYNIDVGTDGGIWRLPLDQADRTYDLPWQDLNGNLANAQVIGLASSPTDINDVVAGINDNGISQFDSQGNDTASQVWSIDNTGAAGEMGGGPVYIDPQNPQIMYAEQTQVGENAILETSTDGGQTWTANSITGITAPYATGNGQIQSSTFPFVMDSNNPERILVGGGVGSTQGPAGNGQPQTSGPALYESTDGGNTWGSSGNPINIAAPLVGLIPDISDIAISQYQGNFFPDPNFPDVTDQGTDSYDSKTIYVTDGTSIYYTKDDGQTWENLKTPSHNNIVSLVVDPRNRDVLYALTQGPVDGQGPNLGEVWMYTDPSDVNGYKNAGGWTQIGSTFGLPADTPVWSLAVDPRNGNLYAGTDLGVYELVDGAPLTAPGVVVTPGIVNTPVWQKFGQGMPNVSVRELNLNLQTNTLLAGTFGRSTYELFLDASQIAYTGTPVQAAVVGVSGESFWTGPVILGGANAAISSAVEVGTTVTIDTATPLDLVVGDSVVINGIAQAGYDGTFVVTSVNDYSTEGVSVFTYTDVAGLSAATVTAATVTNTVTIGADGIQDLPDQFAAATIDFVGPISDLIGNADPSFVPSVSLFKDGGGDIVFAGANIYGGWTDVQEGMLIADNLTALGQAVNPLLDGTSVEYGATLALEADLDAETVDLIGDGISFDGHYDGSLLNISGDNTFSGNVVLVGPNVIYGQDGLLNGTDLPAGEDLSVTIGAESGSELTLTGYITGGDNNGGTDTDLAASTLTLFRFAKEGTGTIAIDNGEAAGVAQPDTYIAVTDVYAGALNLETTTAVASGTGVIQVVDGAQLQVQNPNGDVLPAVAYTNPLYLSGSGIFGAGALEDVGGYTTWLGQIYFTIFPGFSPDTTPLGEVAIGVLNVGDLLTLGTNSTVDEIVQATTDFVTVTGATFTLSFNGGSPTVGIAKGASAATVETDLEAAGVLPAGATVKVVALNNNVYAITLGGTLYNTIIPLTAKSGATVTQSPTQGLEKVGGGTLAVPSTTYYGGQTEVENGILLVQNPNALGSRNSPAAQNTIQQILTVSDRDAGQFQINYDGEVTTLSIGASATAVAKAIDKILTAGGNAGLFAKGGTVTVTATQVETTTESTGPLFTNPTANDGPTVSYAYTVTMGGTLSTSDIPFEVTGVNGTTAAGNFVALGNTDVLVDNGGEVDLDNTYYAPSPLTVNYNLTLNGDGAADINGNYPDGALYNAIGNNVWAGPYYVESPSQIGVNGIQDVQTITVTPGTPETVLSATVNAAAAVGATTVTLNGVTPTSLVGDTVTFGADPSVYTVIAATESAGTTTTLTLSSGLAVGVSAGEGATVASAAPDVFVLSFTGPDATGTVVTDSTSIDPTQVGDNGVYLNDTSPTLAGDIQNALNAFSNIGGVGGNVTVTETAPNVYTVTFGGTLSGLNVNPLTVSTPPDTANGGGSVSVAGTTPGYLTTLTMSNSGYAQDQTTILQTIDLGTLILPARTAKITKATQSSSTVTITTNTPITGLTVGQEVIITGISPSGYDGTFTITSVNAAYTQFTYQAANPGLGTATLNNATVNVINFVGNIYLGAAELGEQAGVTQIDGITVAIGTVPNITLDDGTLSGTGTVGDILGLPGAGGVIYPADLNPANETTAATQSLTSLGPTTLATPQDTLDPSDTFYVSLGTPNALIGRSDNLNVLNAGISLNGATLAGSISAPFTATGPDESADITSASETSTTVTITTDIPLAGLAVGSQVTITGITPMGYDGTFTVASVTGTTITYTAASGLGTATLTDAIVTTPTLVNVPVGDSYVILETDYGTTSNANDVINGVFAGSTPISPTEFNNLPTPAGAVGTPYAYTLNWIDGELFVASYFTNEVVLTREVEPVTLALNIGPTPNTYTSSGNAYTADYGQDVQLTATLTSADTGLPTNPPMLSGTLTFTVTYTDPNNNTSTYTFDEPISTIVNGAGDQVGSYTLDAQTIAAALSPPAAYSGPDTELMPNGTYAITVSYDGIPVSPPYQDVQQFEAIPNNPTTPLDVTVQPTPVQSQMTTSPPIIVPTSPATVPPVLNAYYGQDIEFSDQVKETLTAEGTVPVPMVPPLSGDVTLNVIYTAQLAGSAAAGAGIGLRTVHVQGMGLTASFGSVVPGDTVMFGADPTVYTVGSVTTSGGEVTSITLTTGLVEPVSPTETVTVSAAPVTINLPGVPLTDITLPPSWPFGTAADASVDLHDAVYSSEPWWTPDGIAVGTYQVSAVFPGINQYNYMAFSSTTSSFTVVVQPTPDTMPAVAPTNGPPTTSGGFAVAPPPIANPVYYGEYSDETFTATVFETPPLPNPTVPPISGTVEFEVTYTDSAGVNDGTFTFARSLADTSAAGTTAIANLDLTTMVGEPWYTNDGLAVGTYEVVASYNGLNTDGDLAFVPVSNSVTFTVAPTGDKISVSPTEGPASVVGGFAIAPPPLSSPVEYGQYPDETFTTTVSQSPVPVPGVPPLSGAVVYTVSYQNTNGNTSGPFLYEEPLTDTSAAGTTALAVLDLNSLVAANVPEVETITPGVGPFQLSYNGAAAVSLPADPAAVEVQQVLAAMGAPGVQVLQSGTTYTVVYTGSSALITSPSGGATVTPTQQGDTLTAPWQTNNGLAAGTYTVVASYDGVNTSGFLAFEPKTSSPPTVFVVALPADSMTVTTSASTLAYGQGVSFTASLQLTNYSPAVPPLSGVVDFTLVGSAQITAASESGTTVTITTADPLGSLAIGQSVTISGLSPAGYDGTYTLTSASGDQFTYTAAGGLGTATVPVTAAVSTALFSNHPVPIVDVVGNPLQATATLSNPALYSLLGPDDPLEAAGFNPNNYTLTATFSGVNSSGYLAYQPQSPPPVPFGVDKASTSVGLQVSDANPVYSENVVLTATVSSLTANPISGTNAPTGTVAFEYGPTSNPIVIATVPISKTFPAVLGTSTVYTYTMVDTAIGTYPIYAVYSGDSEYLDQSSNTSPVTVTEDSTITTVTSTPVSPPPYVYGEPVTFTATVKAAPPGLGNPPPQGTVEFLRIVNGSVAVVLANNVPLENIGGTATATCTVTVPGLLATSPTGETIEAIYNPDTPPNPPEFLASSGTEVVDVVRDGTTTTAVTASPTSSTYGQAVTFTTDVLSETLGSGYPSGQVNFFNGSTQIGSGTLSTVTLATGINLTVSDGNASYVAPDGHTPTAADIGETIVVSGGAGWTIGDYVITGIATANVGGNPMAVWELSGDPAGTAGTGTAGGQWSLGVASASYTTTAATQLPAGANTITAKYAGDANYDPTVGLSGVTINVSQDATTTMMVSASPSPAPYGQPVTFTAQVSGVQPSGVTAAEWLGGSPTGTVEFFDNVSEVQAVTDPGNGAFNLSFDGAGPVSIPANATAPQVQLLLEGLSTIGAGNVTVSESGDVYSVAFIGALAGVSQPLMTSTTAGVTVTETQPGGTILLGSSTLNTTSGVTTASYTTSDFQLPAGEASVYATYTSGDSNYLPSPASAPLSETVGADGTNIRLASSAPAPGGAVYGQPVTFTAVVAANDPGAGTPTGTVTFYNGTTAIGSALLALVDGVDTASYTTHSGNLALGSNTISAVFTPSGLTFASSTSTGLSQPVNPDSTTTAISSAGPTGYGNPASFTITVSANSPGAGTPLGTVTVALTQGIFVTPLGQATYVGSSGNTSTYTFTTSQLPVGTNQTIAATYSDTVDGNFLGSFGSTSQTVKPGPDTVTLSTSAASAVYGEPITFTATIAPGAGTAVPTGSVTFSEGSTVLAANVAVVPVAGGNTATAVFTSTGFQLPIGGNLTITATYSGDKNYQSTAGTVAETVNDDPTTTAITASSTAVNVGQLMTFTATVSPASPGGGTPTGTVSFLDTTTGQTLGTGNLANGQATIAASFPAAAASRTQNVEAVYGGSADYLTSTSPPLTPGITVTPVGSRSSKVTVTSSLNPSQYGESVTYTATVTDTGSGGNKTPTGTVTFMAGTAVLGTGTLTATKTGQAVATYTTAATQLALSPSGGPATYSITAVYAGNSTFHNATSAAITQTVDPVPTRTSTLALTSSSPPNSGTYVSAYGQSVTFTATVTDTGTSPAQTPTGTVTFYYLPNGTGTPVSLGKGTLSGKNGTATAAFTTSSLAVGTYTIEAVYGGSLVFKSDPPAEITQVVTPVQTNVTLVSSNPSTVFGQAVKFTATVKTGTGATEKSGSVVFTATDGNGNTTTLGTVSLNADGVAALKTTALLAGSYTITATYETSSTTVSTSFDTVAQTVNQDATAIGIALSSTNSNVPLTITATVKALTPGSGTPTGFVQIFIDGTEVDNGGVAIGSNGKAKLTLPSGVTSTGQHTITIMYEGDNNFESSSQSETVTFTIGRST